MLQEREYVIWGTGRIAQGFYKKYIMDSHSLPKPIFWCDGNSHKQGKIIDGVQVVSPAELFSLCQKYFVEGEEIAIVIGATGINLLQIVNTLEQNSVKAHLYGAVQLDATEYFAEEKEKFTNVVNMLVDDKSKYLYRTIVDNMQKGRCVDFSIAESNQYFANDVIAGLTADDVFVDAGVCNGEEVDKALRLYPGITIHAFEPDKSSYLQLQKKYDAEKNVTVHPQALWHEPVYMSFSTSSVASASRLKDNEQKYSGKGQDDDCVECKPLDKILQGVPVSFIKMDIEGAEYSALLGAREIIVKYRPKLAICVYHNIEDYINIPLLLKTYHDDYKFYFRHHSVTSGESVLYAL